jgi:anaerobic ribonucleoside-triphosphate reductase activating protein
MTPIEDALDDVGVVLRVGAWQERSVANGPGERFVFWLQGCPLRCRGCFNPEFQALEGGRHITGSEAVRMVKAVPGIEGVTYTGGEPFFQAEGLYWLSRLLRLEGLSIVSYSGYTLAELRSSDNQWVRRLLDSLDILIDGRYIEEQRANLPCRGSANQQVHFLSGTYRHLLHKMQQSRREVEFIVGRDGFTSTGILDMDFMKRLEEILRGGGHPSDSAGKPDFRDERAATGEADPQDD